MLEHRADSERWDCSMKIRIRIEVEFTTVASLITAVAAWFKR